MHENVCTLLMVMRYRVVVQKLLNTKNLSHVFSKFMQDKYGDTALIQACRHGDVETAMVLLDHGANVDHQNEA